MDFAKGIFIRILFVKAGFPRGGNAQQEIKFPSGFREIDFVPATLCYVSRNNSTGGNAIFIGDDVYGGTPCANIYHLQPLLDRFPCLLLNSRSILLFLRYYLKKKEIPLDGGPNISDQFYSYVAGIIFYNCCELFNFFFISFDAPSEYHCSSRIFVLFPVIVANSVSSISFPDIVIIFVYREIVDGVNETVLSIVDQFRPVFENIYRNIIIEIYYSHFFLNYWKLLPLKNSRIKSKFRARMDQSDTHFFNT